MHLEHLSLADFRCYPSAEVPLVPGVTAFVGPNGSGKTNLVEAVGYLASLGSHRVATDAPLVRVGAERAVLRGRVVREGRRTLVEVEISPGRANRARVNRSPLPRARDALGILHVVTFAPEDLAVVKGDPSERRRFLDELLVARAPRQAAVRSDYERILKQRNALLKSAGSRVRTGGADMGTLDVWDSHLAHAGAALLAARLELVTLLQPLVDKAYDAVAAGRGGRGAGMVYRSSLPVLPPADASVVELAEALLAALGEARRAELDRGVSLVGPHRDDLVLLLGAEPAKGYASHGESWSYALALRLASYDVLRSESPAGESPVLVLDDVFAELDTTRRDRLADLVSGAEQVLVTAAVDEDVPAALDGRRVQVRDGEVRDAG